MPFFHWLNEVRMEFRALITGSLALAAMGLAQGLWAVPIPRLAYGAVSAAFLGWAFFLAWDKRDKALKNTQAAIRESEETIKGKDAEIANLKREFSIKEQNYLNDISDLRQRLSDLPKLELYLESQGAVRDIYEPRTPVRSFVLGLRNIGRGTAKFPSIRYKRASGLTVDNYGIDGTYGFGLPRSPSDNQWEAFRGGSDQVIRPGETLKITKLIQRGTPKGADGLPLPKSFGPTGQSLYSWIFDDVTFECEISAEGIPPTLVKETVPTETVKWPSG